MSKVTRIIPEGATLTRADGSAVNVGDDVAAGEALTITARSVGGIAPGCAVVFDGPVVPGVAERFTVAPVVSDTATPSRALSRASAGVPPAVKVQ